MNVGVVTFRKALMEEFLGVMNKSVVALTKSLVVDVFNGVTNMTPVDTGRARASWAIGIGAPSDYVPPDVDPATKRERARKRRRGIETPPIFDPPAPGQSQDALSLIDGNEVIYVTTNLPYMERLESGTWSKKAPAGMVRVTVAAVETNMEARIAKAVAESVG